MPATDASTQTEQQIEFNEQQNSEQQNLNWKLIVSELQEVIDKMYVDFVRVVRNDYDDIQVILKEQKAIDTIKVIKKIMDRVETEWDIQSANWGKGLIS